ncbi:uncharacterized protein LOC124272407 [Haliotis rubra]|uniref:uncharacterized protein LOC124272407 n=1 Tax=Haliotis rubra TaxID=36100 RepID=UPI001EE4ED72|nr:uncharacterized protein LOC124272407 [Haliotis rubra]
MAEIDPPFCEVKHVNSKIGDGVFATQDLSEGDFVLEYHGELISMKEANVRNEKYEKDKEGSFLVYFQDKKGTRLCVDATHSKAVGRFVNDGWKKHEKNCFLRIVQCENKSYICLFANRDIKRGEEFRFDYGVPKLPWRKKRRGKRRGKCGICPGCVRIDDCRMCRTCKNMKRFGGPGTMKKKCMLKLCHKMMDASPGQSFTPQNMVTSSQKLPTTVKKTDEKAVNPSTQPVTKSKRTDHEYDDFVSQQRKTASQDNRKRKSCPVSLPRIKLSRPKTSKKCLKYSAVPSRKTRGVGNRNQSTISPKDSGTSNLISKNTRSKVYDFDNFDEIQPLESGSQEVRKQTHSEEHTSAPGQSRRKDKEHTSTPGQSRRKDIEHTSTPGQSRRKDIEHTSTPGQSRRKDKEHTSTPGQSSCKDIEHVSAPGQGRRKDIEHTSTPGQSRRKDKEHTSAPGQSRRKDKDHMSAPGQSRRKDKEHTSTPWRIRYKDKEHMSAPGQSSCKDKDTAWFEGTELAEEAEQNTEEESQNVSSQNDMTYLTQRKYSSTTRRAKLDGIIAKLRSKSDSFMAELSSDDVFLKDKNISKKRRCRSDIFEKEDRPSGGLLSKRESSEVQDNKPIMEKENVPCGRRLSKRKSSEVSENQPVMEKENVPRERRLSKRKSSEVQDNQPILEKENVQCGGRLSRRESSEVQDNQPS